MTQKPLDDLVDFAKNPDPRAPCTLVLDTSGSMAGEALAELNQGLGKLAQALQGNVLARRRVETAVITFDDDTRVVTPFATSDSLRIPTLVANGSTRMGAGIELGLATLEARKATFKQAGISYYRPWYFLMTDGAPTDDAETLQRARAALLKAQSDRKIVFFAIGVGGAADMPFLASLCAGDRKPARMNGLAFEEFFVWLSQSMTRVSQSKVGDKVDLPTLTWGSVET